MKKELTLEQLVAMLKATVKIKSLKKKLDAMEKEAREWRA